MRQLIYGQDGALEWRDAPDPALDAGSALVRPIAVALCDADTAVLAGHSLIPPPYAVGHEVVAEVLEVAGGVPFAPGDRVVVPFQISCGACAACAAGRTGNCRTVPRLSMYGFGVLGGDWGGALADILRVPFAAHMLVPLPDGVSAAAAANASDNVADAWRCVVPALRERPGADVLVVGGGGPSIGLWAAELAIIAGAGSVTYVDDDPERLRLAEAAGARVQEGPPPRRLDEREITVDASGSPEGLACCLRSTAPDGICVSPSIYAADPALPLLEMYSKNATFVTGRPHGRALLPETLALIAEGRFDPLRIATVVPWNDVPGAIPRSAPKVVVERR